MILHRWAFPNSQSDMMSPLKQYLTGRQRLQSQCVTVSLESLDCEFWCNFDTHCLSGHMTVGISLGRGVMNGVFSDHTAHM